jgi:glycosyltransferase involved in cell wall biosynthesis
MISVVIPTLNAERTLAHTLAALVPAVVDGVAQEAILADGGSSDDTSFIADAAGVHLIDAPRGRGSQLAAGAAQAKGDWLLFLDADTVLEPGWAEEAQAFIERVESGRRGQAASFFRFALDDDGVMPRLAEFLAWLRCQLFAMPYGEQGMLISRRLYDRLGGFRSPEGADLVRRLKRGEMVMLKTRAVTCAQRYRSEGYAARGLRTFGQLLLSPVRALARLYG